MSILGRKKGDSKKATLKAPSFDPYGRFSNTEEGLFGFRKDRHVVMPGVTSYEERRLLAVRDYVEKETGKECTLPQELINDVYSLYVNKDIKRRQKDKANDVRHRVLDKVYNSLTKVVTVDSPLFTQILTRELAMVLQKVDDEVKKEQQEKGESQDGIGDQEGEGEGESDASGQGEGEGNGGSDSESNDKGAGKGSGSGSRESHQDSVDKALDNAKEDIQKAMDKADDKIKDMEDKLGKEAMKDLSNSEPEFLEKIDSLKEALSRVSINKESIGKVLEKILNESQNYFSNKFNTIEESLFECEECEDLFGLEFLHPIFKNAELMNVGNETRVYKGKIDLFLDCSGSMNSQETFEGTRIRMIDLVKGIAMVLFRMGMIDNLYFFDGSLYKIDNVNELTILSFSKSGGTDFEKVISKIKKNGNNSVIITDGEDRCSTYDKKTFWVGVGGTRFGGYYSRDDDDSNAFNRYKANRQCVTYNSSNSKFEYVS